MKFVPIIIPAYEPDNRLIELLKKLDTANVGPVFIVDDGSGTEYEDIFETAAGIISRLDGIVLKHDSNKGKGRALKTAFHFVLDKHPDALAVVTADSDGQHTPECIRKVVETVMHQPESLILGVRKFDLEGIPWKSRFGNKLTEKIFSYITGVHVCDTQTGLRGIPRSFMKELLNTKGERFEFEMRMLLEAADRYNVVQIFIDTVYDSEDHHQTHFNPIKDSIKIYRILGERFFKYIFSSLSSSVVDLVFFYLLSGIFELKYPLLHVTIATVVARVISATYNYAINYIFVFKSQSGHLHAIVKYVALAFVQMWLSAGLITIAVYAFPHIEEVLLKVVIDTILFFASYYVQQKVVFRGQKL